MCSCVINGEPHGPESTAPRCQTSHAAFQDGETITIEPFRAKAFPLIKDLVVDRSAFDRVIQAGGFVSVSTGSAPDGNVILVPKTEADLAMDAAACIGCGACVAACKNASAMLFVSAKVSHLDLLPQGQAREGSPRPRHGDSNGRRRFRRLHRYGFLRSRLPESHQSGFHLQDESGLLRRIVAHRRKKAASAEA